MKLLLNGKLWIGLALVLPVIFLLPFLGGFFFNAGSAYTDMAISHYPNMLYLQQALQTHGQVPFWSSSILSGTPATANPLSGLHYPLGWVALLFPLPFGLNFTAVLHLLLGGWGMYLFLRGENFSPAVALFGGIAYEAMPKLFAHLGAGHLTLVYAAGWGPWLLLSQQWVRKDIRRYWMVPGIVLGVIFLADPRYAATAGVIWVAYLISYWMDDGRAQLWLKWVWKGLQAAGTVVIAFAVGAVLWLPMLEYVGLSTRSTLTSQDLLTLSLPPFQLLGFVVPNMAGTAEWMLYPGAVVFTLAMLALVFPGQRRKAGYWIAFFVLCVIWSLGENIPGISVLSEMPGIHLLRVPPRMMLAGFVGLIVAACLGLQTSITVPETLKKLPKFNPLLGLVGLDFLIGLLAVAIGVINREFPWHFIWGSVALTATLFMIFRYRAGKLQSLTFGILIVAWLLVDTAVVNYTGMAFHPVSEVLSQGRKAADMLVTQAANDDFRVYSPSYSIPQQTAANMHIELADGIDPLQLTAYAQFMRVATGVPSGRYSVTLPPFATGDPQADNKAYSPVPQLLGLLNVRYVVSAFPLAVGGLSLQGQVDGAYVYRNENEKPRAWVQDSLSNIEIKGTPVRTLLRSPNQIELSAAGPGYLVVSEMNYPGWNAFVDGQAVPILPIKGILRGINLAQGNHTVRMVFQPVRFFWGMGISLGTCLACLLAFWLGKRQRHAE